ncbi:hypothetical protein SH668x_002616 [Planctomicrobium sp. SH668]|uniref:hypothetical protein n=1 Tax=Planctomicrobium sp. SH668 TaxID=3448126 RepID=UPI003F5AFA50
MMNYLKAAVLASVGLAAIFISAEDANAGRRHRGCCGHRYDSCGYDSGCGHAHHHRRHRHARHYDQGCYSGGCYGGYNTGCDTGCPAPCASNGCAPVAPVVMAVQTPCGQVVTHGHQVPIAEQHSAGRPTYSNEHPAHTHDAPVPVEQHSTQPLVVAPQSVPATTVNPPAAGSVTPEGVTIETAPITQPVVE